jgi:hypothetical protein
MKIGSCRNRNRNGRRGRERSRRRSRTSERRKSSQLLLKISRKKTILCLYCLFIKYRSNISTER